MNEYTDIFQYLITMLFMWSLINISGAGLMIQIQLVEYKRLLQNFNFAFKMVIFEFANLGTTQRQHVRAVGGNIRSDLCIWCFVHRL